MKKYRLSMIACGMSLALLLAGCAHPAVPTDPPETMNLAIETTDAHGSTEALLPAELPELRETALTPEPTQQTLEETESLAPDEPVSTERTNPIEPSPQSSQLLSELRPTESPAPIEIQPATTEPAEDEFPAATVALPVEMSTEPPTEPPTESTVWSITDQQLAEIEAYGNAYAQSLGAVVDYSMTLQNAGYAPPGTIYDVSSTDMDGCKRKAAACVDVTWAELTWALGGNMEGVRLRVVVVMNTADTSYPNWMDIYVLYG